MTEQEMVLSAANIHWDDSGLPFSKDYDDIYFSKASALEESSYVFLNANNLESRWKKLDGANFIIGECGFGSGLNFLNTSRLWCDLNPEGSTLHYIACELHPLQVKDIERLYLNFQDLEIYSEVLLKNYPALTPGVHRRELTFGKNKVILTLLFGDASQMLKEIWQANGFRVDAWYLDGFSPTKNSSMWNEQLFTSVASLSKTSTTLSTYSAAGEVKKALINSGFTHKRIKGFAHKRHMLIAKCLQPPPKAAEQFSAWQQVPAFHEEKKNVLIIGGGLAGCSSAYALANSGWKVTLIEREPEIANKASGNSLGVVYCKLSGNQDASSDYYRQSYLYALWHYQQIHSVHNIEYSQTGLLQLAYDDREKARQLSILNKPSSSHLCRAVNAIEASEKSNLALNTGGLFFPSGSFLNPKALCKSYIDHPAIDVINSTEAIRLNHDKALWHIESSSDFSAKAQAVIIANSLDTQNFEQSKGYPLTSNLGQIDQFPKSEAQNPNCIVCAKGYLLPAHKGLQTIGGYTNSNSDGLKDKDATRRNLALLNTIDPDLSSHFAGVSPTVKRSALRCSSPDYLPLVGPIEDRQLCLDIYKDLQRNAHKKIPHEPAYHRGLYLNVGHGSHGLTSTPIAATYLASLLNNEPLPLNNSSLNCLHPIRFLIKDLKKQRLV